MGYFPSAISLILLLAVCARETRAAGWGRNLKQQLGGVETDEPLPSHLPTLTCDGFQGPFAYMVSVRDLNGDHFCGGVVVSKTAVVTAAHCIDVRVSSRTNPRPVLYIGGWDTETPIEKRRTVNVVVPQSWTGNVDDGNDIAILELDEPTCVKFIPSLGYRQLSEETSLKFLGFGRTSDGGSFAFHLHAGNFSHVENTNCENSYKLKNELTPRIMCGRSQVSGGVCSGDEGGPLIYQPTLLDFKDTVVGIASYSNGECTDAEGVAMFTRMQPYKWWIKNQLKKLAADE